MDRGAPEPAEVLEDQIALRETVRRACHVEVAADILRLVGTHLEAQRAAIEAFHRCHLGVREGTSLLRYPEGGFYLPHVDRGYVPSWPDAGRRAITVVLFLESSREADPSGGFSGGSLRLAPEPPDDASVAIVPVRGTLVAFRATTSHEVTRVVGGRRDAIVDWFLDAPRG